jgi:hypothetical protein
MKNRQLTRLAKRSWWSLSDFGSEVQSQLKQRWSLQLTKRFINRFEYRYNLEWNLLTCKLVDTDQWQDVEFYVTERGKASVIDDMPWVSWSCPIVSRRLKEFLELHTPDSFQFLPVKVYSHAKTRDEAGEFWAANLLRYSDCADWTKYSSTIQRSNEKWVYFESWMEPAIDVSKIPHTLNVFRVRYFPDIIIVSSLVAQAIVREGFTGVQFPFWPLSTDPTNPWGKPWPNNPIPYEAMKEYDRWRPV